MTQDKKNPFRAYNLRRGMQVLSLAAFLTFLIYLDPLTSEGFPASNIFLRLSPLAGLGASIAAKDIITQYWPALVLVAATLFMGRFFCGWLCPFGFTIDLTDRFFRKQRERGWSIYDKRRLKYYLLAFLLLSLFLSRQILGWFDPLSLATNTYSILIHPYLVALLGGFFDFLYGLSALAGAGGLVEAAHGFSNKVLFVHREPFFRNHSAFLLVFLTIISFGILYQRYWCRNLCPLGALLAIGSIGAYFHRRVREGCDTCAICQKGCRMGAITQEGKATLAGECILCMNCQELCPLGVVRFSGTATPKLQEVDLSRRGLITACFASIASVPMLRFNFPSMWGKGHKAIRPPGSLGETEFLAKCVRCGECMKVCKTNGLHPTLLETGLEGAWTPRLIPRIGHCEYTCTLCSHVCPSGAIRSQELPKKQELAIGKAYIDHSRCIPWVGYARLPELSEGWQDVNCGVCEEVCPVPTKAIHFNTYVDASGREIRRPFVREEACNGCGFCEYACPVQGKSAIVVEGIQPQLPIKLAKAKDFKVKYCFPEKVGGWRTRATPAVYSGANGLYEYIDGGAEPYLSYAFEQVAVAEYEDNSGRRILAEVWQFSSSEDAFGVYTRDRSGSEYTLGDEASIYENYLWVWKGRHYLRLEPRTTDIRVEDVGSLAEAVVELLPPGRSSRPSLLGYLPEEGLVHRRTKFFHQKIILDSVNISEQHIEENVFGLGEKTRAVVAEYLLEKGLPTTKLMLVEYPSQEEAERALEGFIRLRKSWGEEPIGLDTLQCFKDKNGRFSTACRKGRLLITIFLAPDRLWAEDYTRAVARATVP